MSLPTDDLGDGIIRAEACAYSAPIDLSGIGHTLTLSGLPSAGGPSNGCAMRVDGSNDRQAWNVDRDGGAIVVIANTGARPCHVHGKLLRPGRMVRAIWSKRWKRWIVRRWPRKAGR